MKVQGDNCQPRPGKQEKLGLLTPRSLSGGPRAQGQSCLRWALCWLVLVSVGGTLGLIPGTPVTWNLWEPSCDHQKELPGSCSEAGAEMSKPWHHLHRLPWCPCEEASMEPMGGTEMGVLTPSPSISVQRGKG